MSLLQQNEACSQNGHNLRVNSNDLVSCEAFLTNVFLQSLCTHLDRVFWVHKCDLTWCYWGIHHSGLNGQEISDSLVNKDTPKLGASCTEFRA